MRKALPIIIVFSLFLSGCTLTGNKNNQENPSQEQSQESNQEQTFSGSFTEAVRKGIGLKCTYQIEEHTSEGYIKGKKYRGKIQSQGKVSQVIMKDNCMWVWDEGQDQGFKTCYEPEEADETLWGDSGDSESTEINTPQGQYKCKPAVIGEDKFTPPADIKFMDLQEMMQGYTNQ